MQRAAGPPWMMDQANAWGPPRYVILLVVVLLHLALFAALLMPSRTRGLSPAAEHSVELLYLPPAALPAVRSAIPPPRRLSSGAAIVIASPPVLDSSSLSTSPSASSSSGSGAGIDWAAEARRALQAFEIRRHHPPSASSVSIDPAEDNWWPRARHHAGDQYKTPNGDWIVWVNDHCYQVAALGSSTYGAGSAPPQTICPAGGGPKE